MRLFIALNLPQTARSCLLEQMEHWKQEGVSGCWTSAENLHLTLAFLGEQPESALSTVEACLQAVPFPSLRLSVKGVGTFGSLLYADFDDSSDLEKLEDYVRALRGELRGKGISFDSKAFRPHITLARRMRCPDGLRLSIQCGPFPVKVCTLFSSTLSAQGACYRALCSIGPFEEKEQENRADH